MISGGYYWKKKQKLSRHALLKLLALIRKSRVFIDQTINDQQFKVRQMPKQILCKFPNDMMWLLRSEGTAVWDCHFQSLVCIV